MKLKPTHRGANRGAVLIIAMVFLLLFATLAVSLCSIAGTNAQVASNQHKVNSALYAAQSGLECAKRIVSNVSLQPTMYNTVSDTDANTAWAWFCEQATARHGQDWTSFTDEGGGVEGIVTGPISFGSPDVSFRLRFYRYNDDPRTIKFEAIGSSNEITRRIGMDMEIRKDASVMQYAIASRGRMWLTGDSTIHGSIFSDWDNKLPNGNPVSPSQSPFDVTSDSRVEGTINTVISREDCISASWQLDGPDEDGQPTFDEEGNLIYDEDDEIQGYHEGINYGQQPDAQMPGMDISDYDTTLYYNATSANPIYYSGSATNYTGNLDSLGDTCGTKYRYEYFPHAAGDYTANRPGGGGLQRKRWIYKNQIFTDARLPDNVNALFINCEFNGVLYVDCGQTSSSYVNNVRFDNCRFYGTIVSDTPQYFNWQKNCLYFTGGATFQNEDYAEATILAPHFNVNLGNTNPVSGDENTLRGAIVGGIVDVRGNAQVYGTIISMADTSSYTSGYVTNIGATLADGGSETTQPGDVGTIDITPVEDKLLPSGILSPIVIKPLLDTYSEGV